MQTIKMTVIMDAKKKSKMSFYLKCSLNFSEPSPSVAWISFTPDSSIVPTGLSSAGSQTLSCGIAIKKTDR